MTGLTRYVVGDAVATITLDSPANRNALSRQLVAETVDHLRAAAGDDAVRAVVLTHTGGVFCAGADLREQTAEGGPQEGTARLLGLLRTIVELPKPVIACVDGAARAGGVGVIGACDLAIATGRATFAFTEVRLGLAPAMITLTTLPRLSERAASRYLLTGETFGAGTAAEIGLVTTATENLEDLDAELATLTEAFRACSPQGLAATKPLTTRAVLTGFDDRADTLQALSARLFASDEAQEGMRAFLEKRPPRWATP